MWSKIYLTLHQLLWILLMIIIFVRRGPSLAGERLLHWKMEEQNAMFQIPLVNLLYDQCLPCFYIVSISTSTTKCFLSPFPFSQNKLDKNTKKKELPNAWRPWTFTLWTVQQLYIRTCMTSGRQSLPPARQFAVRRHRSNSLNTSRLHVTYIPSPWVASLYVRDCDRCYA